VRRSKNRYKDAQQRREAGGFIALPHAVIRSTMFHRLSAHAVKLLMALLAQYRGDNNGDLAMTWNMLKDKGWFSRDTLNKASKELLKGEWIIVSRRGGRNRASLYAITFYAVDECRGKLDIRPTGSPLGLWKKNEPLPPLPKMNGLARRASLLRLQ
jgi:hypothetical protein